MDQKDEIALTELGLGASSREDFYDALCWAEGNPNKPVEHSHREDRKNYSGRKSYDPDESQIDFQGLTYDQISN